MLLFFFIEYLISVRSVTGTSRERGPCEARGLSPFEHVYLSSNCKFHHFHVHIFFSYDCDYRKSLHVLRGLLQEFTVIVPSL